MDREALNINICDYLSDDRIEAIAEEELRQALRQKLHSRENCEIFISNLAYDVVLKEVADIAETNTETMRRLLADTIFKICGEQRSIQFEMFREHKGSIAMKIINEIIEDKRPWMETCIVDAVNEEISTNIMRELREDIEEMVMDAIWRKFAEVKSNES